MGQHVIPWSSELDVVQKSYTITVYDIHSATYTGYLSCNFLFIDIIFPLPRIHPSE